MCYSRHHCPAYLLPEGGNLPAQLVPLATSGAMTTDQALEAARWLREAKAAISASMARSSRSLISSMSWSFPARFSLAPWRQRSPSLDRSLPGR
jgi:hypothetical protein